MSGTGAATGRTSREQRSGLRRAWYEGLSTRLRSEGDHSRQRVADPHLRPAAQRPERRKAIVPGADSRNLNANGCSSSNGSTPDHRNCWRLRPTIERPAALGWPSEPVDPVAPPSWTRRARPTAGNSRAPPSPSSGAACMPCVLRPRLVTVDEDRRARSTPTRKLTAKGPPSGRQDPQPDRGKDGQQGVSTTGGPQTTCFGQQKVRAARAVGGDARQTSSR